MENILSYLQQTELAEPIRIAATLTLLSFIPAVVVAMTCFTRFIVVFSLLRFALGLQQTPPNIVIIILSLFMTLFAMGDTLQNVNQNSVQPYSEGKIELVDAIDRAEKTFKQFMARHTREEDLSAIIEISESGVKPSSIDEVSLTSLVPAFLLSELRTAFKIGFLIFVPFLLVDLITSSVLMSLGMIMLPPVTVSMPIKIMLFVLIDGWSLITTSLISSVVN